jgi:hypothetical protein
LEICGQCLEVAEEYGDLLSGASLRSAAKQDD